VPPELKLIIDKYSEMISLYNEYTIAKNGEQIKIHPLINSQRVC